LFVGTTAIRGVAISSSNLVRWGAWAGILGGLLWALFPLGELPEVDSVLTPRGSLVCYGLGYLLPQLLLLVGSAGLHALRKRSYGWLGSVGFFVSFVALVLVFISGAWEMTKIASTGVGSTVGYWTSMMGYFLLAWGSGLLGLAITGTPRDPPSYLGGLLLAIAVPLGLLFAFATGDAWDFGFWVGLTVPYGVAWVFLGYALMSKRNASVERPAHVS
jgi:hypothetical protein